MLPEIYLVSSREIMNNIIDFSCYNHYKEFYQYEEFHSVEKFFGIKIANIEASYENGENIYLKYREKKVYVGLNKEILFDYYNNHKTEFDKILLIAFLALKSIIQKSPYKRITNAFWLSRMAGFERQQNELPDWIKKYSSNFKLRKIKDELEANWYLKYYSSRGFYATFQMTLEDLIRCIERKKNDGELLKERKKEIKNRIRKELRLK